MATSAADTKDNLPDSTGDIPCLTISKGTDTYHIAPFMGDTGGPYPAFAMDAADQTDDLETLREALYSLMTMQPKLNDMAQIFARTGIIPIQVSAENVWQGTGADGRGQNIRGLLILLLGIYESKNAKQAVAPIFNPVLRILQTNEPDKLTKAFHLLEIIYQTIINSADIALQLTPAALATYVTPDAPGQTTVPLPHKIPSPPVVAADANADEADDADEAEEEEEKKTNADETDNDEQEEKVEEPKARIEAENAFVACLATALFANFDPQNQSKQDAAQKYVQAALQQPGFVTISKEDDTTTIDFTNHIVSATSSTVTVTAKDPNNPKDAIAEVEKLLQVAPASEVIIGSGTAEQISQACAKLKAEHNNLIIKLSLDVQQQLKKLASANSDPKLQELATTLLQNMTGYTVPVKPLLPSGGPSAEDGTLAERAGKTDDSNSDAASPNKKKPPLEENYLSTSDVPRAK